MDFQSTLEYMRHTPWNWYYVCDWDYMCPGITQEEHEKSFEEYCIRHEKLDEIGSTICSLLMPVSRRSEARENSSGRMEETGLYRS